MNDAEMLAQLAKDIEGGKTLEEVMQNPDAQGLLARMKTAAKPKKTGGGGGGKGAGTGPGKGPNEPREKFF